MSSPAPRLIVLGETVSTNADAMRLAKSGEALPLWVMAKTQSGGRGRSGRSWVSVEGNLHASLAFSCSAPLPKAPEIALVAGIALHDAVQAVSSLAPEAALRLKWPNDLMIGTGKAGGILVESTAAPEGQGFLAVAGFGLNIVAAPADLGRAATAMCHHASVPGTDDVISALSAAMDRWLETWSQGKGFAAIREAWITRAGPMGEAITINTRGGLVRGTYRGLSDSGALLVECGGSLKEFTYGDVALVTDAGKDGPA